jgi:hypothetical protein
MNSREQACWLTLVFESKLSVRTVNDILVVWCKQLERTIEDFFAVDAQAWRAACRLKEEFIQKTDEEDTLPGNKQLLELGGTPLHWPATNVNAAFAPLLQTAQTLQHTQLNVSSSPS